MQTPFSYRSDCVSLDSYVELDQSRVDIYVSKAKEIFDRRFGAGSFCETAHDTHILVWQETEWECLEGMRCAGISRPFSQIELARFGTALEHEMIHEYESRHLVIHSDSHENWWPLGYFAMSDEFWDFVSSEEIKWIKKD